MKIKHGILSLILSLSTLTGCGDLFKKDVVDKPLESSRLRADCELNMDDLSDILERPITGTINCLEKNLNLFMDVSELSRGEKLARVALVKYLKRNKPDIDPKTYAIIDAVFALSNLITGEEKDFISRKNVAAMMELMRAFNLHAYRHYANTFGSDAPANLPLHESHRKRVEAAANEIKMALEKIYVPDRKGEIHFLEIMKLVESFIDEDDSETIEKIEGMLFAKKIIVGGDTATINHKELGFLFNHLPKLLSLVLDAVRYQHLTLEQKDVFQFMQEDVADLANILFHPSRGDRRYEGLFSIEAALEGIDRFMDDGKKISKYRALIIEGKKILTKRRQMELTAEDEWVTGKDLETIFNHVFNVTTKGIAFHRFYNSSVLKPLLDSPQSIYLDPKKYELDFPQDKAELADFCRIVNTYRYIKGNTDFSNYGREYKRNANGVAEIASFEYLIKTAFGYYGSSLSMGDEQLREIMKKFENELIDMDIILPRRARNTAETIALLGSLFQYQSDDNKVLDVDEATEFAVSLTAAMKAKTELYKFYEAKKCTMDEFGRIEPDCFRDNFYEGICTKYRQYFPLLFQYLSADGAKGCDQNFNSEHNITYFNTSAKAARTCHFYEDDKAEIFYSESDIMSILLEMMHVETTIARWDLNNNNLMDPDEVMNAYSIYKPAIQGMLPKLPSVLDTPKIRETLAKQVFLYLVKFEEVPQTKTGKDIWKLVKFLLSFNAKKAPATRKTISSILWIVSEQGKVKAAEEGEPVFDCNWLHDPTNIPRD